MPEIEYSTIQIAVKMQLYFQNGITFVLFLKNKKSSHGKWKHLYLVMGDKLFM